MERTTIKLHIDFKESIDVKSFSNVLNSIDGLFLSQAAKNKEDIYRLQKSTEYITPKCLEIKEINKGSIDVLLFLSGVLTGVLANFITDGIKHLFNRKHKKSSELMEAPELRQDIYEIIEQMEPEEFLHIKSLCLSVVNSTIEKLRITLSDGDEFEIGKQEALLILKETWCIQQVSTGKAAKIDYARRSLSSVPMRIYCDEMGHINGSINENKTRYPVFFANERIKDQIINKNGTESHVFYADIEDIRVNGKTKQYEVNGISNYSDQPLSY